MKKELKTEIIQSVLKKINEKIPLKTLPNIIFKKDLYLKNREGEFKNHKIYIQSTDDVERMEFVLVHEIGHYIHSKYFKEKDFKFHSYSYKGKNECFAENFTDYIYSLEVKDDDLNKMDIILKSKII